MELRRLPGVPPLGVDEPLGQVIKDLVGPHAFQVAQIQVHGLAHDSGVPHLRRTNQFRGQLQHMILVEFSLQPVIGRLHAITRHPREADLQRVPLRPHRMHPHRLSRRLRRGDHGLRSEVEGDAQHIGVLDVEQVFLVEVVGLAPERAPDRLLAQQLGTERPHAEHVGDGVRVPSLGQHRHRDHAADRVAERARLPDGVHHFTKQLLVGDVVSVTAISGALDPLPPKALDLVGGDLAEVPVQRVAGLEL